MKLISWNVNGIRAMEKKGIFEWMTKENADIYCFQETKIQEDQLTDQIKNVADYHSDWFYPFQNKHVPSLHESHPDLQ